MRYLSTTAATVAIIVALVLLRGCAPVVGDCRIFAVGDIHGDKDGAIMALRAGGVVDEAGAWIAGCSTLVQTGDIVDRGAQSLAALHYFRELGRQAVAHGGEVVMLLGNHEMLNFEGSTEYAHPDELAAAGGRDAWRRSFGPQGEHRKWMRELDVVRVVNGTVFVHAGILPQYAALGARGLNRLARLQLRKGAFNAGVLGEEGPTWTRKIITDAARGECRELEMSLSLLGGTRMVVGHTIQASGKVGRYCQGQLIAIDIAISKAIMGNPGCVEFSEHDIQAHYHKRGSKKR